MKQNVRQYYIKRKISEDAFIFVSWRNRPWWAMGLLWTSDQSKAQTYT
jgi:hypothetical protein